MLDLNNPLGFIADLVGGAKTRKYYRLIAGCCVSAFIGFWGGFGLSGASMLAAFPGQFKLALVSGFFSGATLMAAGVLWTVQKQGMWKDLGIALPKQFEEVIEETDVGKK